MAESRFGCGILAPGEGIGQQTGGAGSEPRRWKSQEVSGNFTQASRLVCCIPRKHPNIALALAHELRRQEAKTSATRPGDMDLTDDPLIYVRNFYSRRQNRILALINVKLNQSINIIGSNIALPTQGRLSGMFR
jgi:hypothetical protein